MCIAVTQQVAQLVLAQANKASGGGEDLPRDGASAAQCDEVGVADVRHVPIELGIDGDAVACLQIDDRPGVGLIGPEGDVEDIVDLDIECAVIGRLT